MFKNIKIFVLLVIALLVTTCPNKPVDSAITKRSRSLFVTSSGTYKDRVIGCLFADVCSSAEICFDDNAFGRCEEWDIQTGSYSSNYVYKIDRKTLQLLEQELNRLNEEGYTWSDEYIQCILKTVLNDRPRTVYDSDKCEPFRYISNNIDKEKTNRIGLNIDDFIRKQSDFQSTRENELDQTIDINSLNNDFPSQLLTPIPKTNSETGTTHNSFDYPKTINDVVGSRVEKPSRNIINSNRDKKKCFDCFQDNDPFILDQQIDQSYDQDWHHHNLDNEARKGKGQNEFFKRLLLSSLDENNLDIPDSQSNAQENSEIDLLEEDNNGNSIDLESTPNNRVLREVDNQEEKYSTNNQDYDDVAIILVNDDNPNLEDNEGQLLVDILKDARIVDEDEKIPFIINEADIDPDNVLTVPQFVNNNDFEGNQAENNKDILDDNIKEILFGDINYSNNNLDEEKPNFNRMHRYDIKKPGPRYVEEYFFENFNNQNDEKNSMNGQIDDDQNFTDEIKIERKVPENKIQKKKINLMSTKPVAEGPVKVDAKSENILLVRSADEGEETSLEAVDSTHTYVITDKTLGEEESQKFVQNLEQIFKLPRGTFSNSRKEGNHLTFKVNPNYRELNASQVASRIEDLAKRIQKLTGFLIKESGIGDKAKLPVVSPNIIRQKNEQLISLTLMTCSIVLAFILAAFVIFLFKRNANFREKVKTFSKDFSKFDYQDLWRQHMKEKNDPEKGDSQNKKNVNGKLKNVDTNLANQQGSQEVQVSPPSRSSISSWVEEPVSSNMDITTGHIILSYMEDHLKKKDRLEKEWEALCAYEADPCCTNAAVQKQNANKSRYSDIVPFDHSRVILDDLNNASHSDYINASTITDHDPRNPVYIATQGPMANTKADFWQMIWEQGSVIIVMLARLRENGLSMCDRYWPEEGSEKYHNYEVHLVSEHIWCDDYLVRSFYLKNAKTGETRTVTQFHFLSWPDNGIPPNTKSILDFRRKINKSYRGRSCPIVVHCTDGIGRTGTYILIDMVLNRLAKGAKEIDIAATLEHIRDQRMGMVKTKAQLEFVLLSVAEEVQAILKALSLNN